MKVINKQELLESLTFNFFHINWTGNQIWQIWSWSESRYHLVLTWFGRWTWLARRVRSQTSFGQKPFWWCLHPSGGWHTHTHSHRSPATTCTWVCSHTLPYLKDLWARFIVGFGILDQQVYVFRHGVDTGVVANLKPTHLCLAENHP